MNAENVFAFIIFTIFDTIIAKHSNGHQINHGNHFGRLNYVRIPPGRQIQHQNQHQLSMLQQHQAKNNHCCPPSHPVQQQNHIRPSHLSNWHPLVNWLNSKYNTGSFARPIHQRPTTQLQTDFNTHSRLFKRKYNEWKRGWWRDHVATCGRQKVKPYNMRLRIIGGREARKGSWPWMVSFFFETIHQDICAGTLIDNQWVVTAAHCFFGPFNNTNGFRVRLGTHNNSEFSEDKSEQIFKISNIIRHPNYKDFGADYPFNNDIALVKLDRSVIYGGYVSPVCLTLDRLHDGEECIVSGWGRIKKPMGSIPDPSAWPEVLQQVSIPIVDWEKCSNLEVYTDKLTENMLCAGYSSGDEDACHGDSGGPLQCQKNDQWFLAGITSWGGKNYTMCAEPLQPGVYTNVSKYLQWIIMEIFKDTFSTN